MLAAPSQAPIVHYSHLLLPHCAFPAPPQIVCQFNCSLPQKVTPVEPSSYRKGKLSQISVPHSSIPWISWPPASMPFVVFPVLHGSLNAVSIPPCHRDAFPVVYLASSPSALLRTTNSQPSTPCASISNGAGLRPFALSPSHLYL